jgi:hypothetical protein
MQKQDILPKPIKITIDRIRQELLKIDYSKTLSVQDFLKLFYMENPAFLQHDIEGSLTADIKGSELTIYNSLADIAPENHLAFCLHFEEGLYCFDINKEDPEKPILVYKTKNAEIVSMNPQWYIGKEPPFKWKRDKDEISMFGYSPFSFHKYKMDEENKNRILYKVEPLTNY